MAEAPERITIVPMTVTAGEPVWDCGEWYADLPEDMADFAVEYVPADALAARDAEIARLTDGIRSALEGTYSREGSRAFCCLRSDYDPHCPDCLLRHLSALIAPRPAPEERP